MVIRSDGLSLPVDPVSPIFQLPWPSTYTNSEIFSRGYIAETISKLFIRHGRACPGHPRRTRRAAERKTWMPVTSAGMTREMNDSTISETALVVAVVRCGNHVTTKLRPGAISRYV
jgi:hypothetical protein